MTRYVALLRAVNVGGTGKLPMSDLRAMCEAAGFQAVRTYIASGNAVFDSDGDEATVKAALERALKAFAGKPVSVMIRTGDEIAATLRADPFATRPPNRVACIFLDDPPPGDWLGGVAGLKDEEITVVGREIFVHYPAGQADTKLKIAAAKDSTGRNMNTVAKLAEIAAL